MIEGTKRKSEAVRRMLKVVGRDPDAVQLAGWLAELEELTPEECEWACTEALKVSHHPPMPALLLDLCGKGPQARAEHVWGWVEKLVGGLKIEAEEIPQEVQAAVARVGGWSRVYDVAERAGDFRGWFRRELIAACHEVRREGERAQLPGRREGRALSVGEALRHALPGGVA